MSDNERCPDCRAELRFHEQGFCPYEVETGEKVMQSQTTGNVYRVTKWVDLDGEAGRVVSLEKELIDDPEERDLEAWSEEASGDA